MTADNLQRNLILPHHIARFAEDNFDAAQESGRGSAYALQLGLATVQLFNEASRTEGMPEVLRAMRGEHFMALTRARNIVDLSGLPESAPRMRTQRQAQALMAYHAQAHIL